MWLLWWGLHCQCVMIHPPDPNVRYERWFITADPRSVRGFWITTASGQRYYCLRDTSGDLEGMGRRSPEAR